MKPAGTENLNDDDAGANEDQKEPTAAELATKVQELTDALEKAERLKRTAFAERDTYKKQVTKKPEGEEDYKTLWKQTDEQVTKLRDKAKNADIMSAINVKLQGKVDGEVGMKAAMGLVNKSLIKWSEDDGVDDETVEAAFQELKNKYGSILFVKKSKSQDATEPAEGAKTTKTMTRAAYQKLTPQDQAKRMREGWTLNG